MTVLIFTILSILIIAVQLLLCFKTKRVWLRLLPTILSGGVTVALFVLVRTATGWEAIGYLLLWLGAGLLFVVDLFAWILFAILRRLRKKEERE
jgi:hypothetical protein